MTAGAREPLDVRNIHRPRHLGHGSYRSTGILRGTGTAEGSKVVPMCAADASISIVTTEPTPGTRLCLSSLTTSEEEEDSEEEKRAEGTAYDTAYHSGVT